MKKVNGYDQRDGTDIDKDNLTELFKQLHFTVTNYDDKDGITGEVTKEIIYLFEGQNIFWHTVTMTRQHKQ